MSPREFIGHCFCDSRFKTIENIILKGTVPEVLELQTINNMMPKFHRHREVAILIEERLNGRD
jgi:hypothetical protein